MLVNRERMAALGELAGGFSHEISTPIGNARMAVTHMKNLFDGGCSEKQDFNDMLDIAETNLSRTSKIINSLKSVSAEEQSRNTEQWNLGEAIDTVMELYGSRLASRDVSVNLDVDRSINFRNYQTYLYDIAGNLVNNSLQHAFPVEIRNAAISFSAAREGDRVAFIYADNGVGMKEDVLNRLFEPFFTTSRTSGGTGIGMYILYNLITSELGGEISVESEPMKGMKIRIVVPVGEHTAKDL